MKNINVRADALLLASALLTPAASYVSAAPQLSNARDGGAGTYHHKTYKPGPEGYDNTVEVVDKGGGRLHVMLSATYLYQENGAETMHEYGSEGDAALRGNFATARVKAEGGDELRVTATLVEFAGCCDVYRSSFVTKVEAYGDGSALLWVATGPEPLKIKMRQ